MAEAYIFYSSIALLAMGCLALILSIVFRLKFRTINSISKKLSANLFNKTFNVFSPYAEHRKIIHHLLLLLPILVFFASFGFAFIIVKLLEYSFIVSLSILIVCLTLIAVEVAPEIYQNTNTFIKAIQHETRLGVGDVKVLQLLRKSLPRLSNYYLGLSILFLTLSVTLSYFWSLILSLLTSIIGLILETGEATGGPLSWIVSVSLFAMLVAFIQILAWKVRNRLFAYFVELPSYDNER